jgi:threonylcarbamoyladenosine tRNA methylthiotransferase MtaB
LSVEVISFGCRLNLAEGEAIRASSAGEDDLIIINSCAVTAEAERQARQAIRRAAKRRPGARIMVTGCAAETNGAAFLAMPEVNGLVPNRLKGEVQRYTKSARPELVEGSSLLPSIQLQEEQPFDKLRASGGIGPAVSGTTHARAFIEVQNGCDHRCTFCIIPYGRGESRSIPAGAVIDAVKAAVDRGQQEVILTGVDLTSYGPDLPGSPTLGLLVERILKHVPTLKRLRLSSLDCIEIDERLFELVTCEPRLMPHLHLSLQSGDDMILKRMKRRHSRAEAVELVARIKAARPEISIGADIIAGFPTESDEMFANSLALLSDCDIVFGHIFPYSPRAGTPAAKMPQVERTVIKARAEKLRTAASARKAAWLGGLVGSQQRVLIELDGQSGHAENFASVRLEHAVPSGNMRGTMMDVKVIGSDGAALIVAPAEAGAFAGVASQNTLQAPACAGATLVASL